MLKSNPLRDAGGCAASVVPFSFLFACLGLEKPPLNQFFVSIRIPVSQTRFGLFQMQLPLCLLSALPLRYLYSNYKRKRTLEYKQVDYIPLCSRGDLNIVMDVS